VSGRKFSPQFLPLVVFGVLWGLLFRHLSVHWAVNPQYSFGWFGPVICAYLFFIRWTTRPPAEKGSARGAKWIFWVAAFALLPTWLIEQPNPDWRVISWLLSIEVVVLSLCGIYFVGGRAWLGHFAFSICFIFTTVPWPAGLEELMTQGLMRVATTITVHSLNLFGIPAFHQGNVIDLQTGLVGIDEACSGIRSFPAAIMVSLFLGELYRMIWQRRIILLVSGILIAFSCNVGRTFLLCVIAAKGGVESMSHWHDPAGFTILSISFLLLWGLAHFLPGSPAGKDQDRISSQQAAPMPFPRGVLVGLGAWLLLIILGTEAWYRAHEAGEKLHWSFEWPVAKEQFSDVVISQYAAEELKFDEGHAASWMESDGSYRTALFLKWGAGPNRSRILAHLHRPEDCLPGAGYILKADRGAITIKIRDLMIPFRVLDFDYNGQQTYVFYCLWQDRPKTSPQPGTGDGWNDRLVRLASGDRNDRLVRFESVLLGQRNLAQQILEVVISGYNQPEEAEAALFRDVETMIRS
jgi:exosortase